MSASGSCNMHCKASQLDCFSRSISGSVHQEGSGCTIAGFCPFLSVFVCQNLQH